MIQHNWHFWNPCDSDIIGECICGDFNCKPDTNTKATHIGCCRQMTKEERVVYYSYDDAIHKAKLEIQHFGVQTERIALLEGLRLMRDELRARIETDCKQ
jgi:hypothetical protein